MKRFSLLFMLVFSSIFAEAKVDLEKYRLYVTKVDAEFHCFALSNNLVFTIPQKQWETETLPELGSEVYVLPAIAILDGHTSFKEEHEFSMIHSENRQKKRIAVWMSEESKQECLSLVSSESVCTEPAGWVFSERYKEVFRLSDGSSWMKEKEGQTVFSSGDRVIVSRLSAEHYLMINIEQVERSSKICFCKTSASSEKMFTRHWSERVKPYILEE